MKPSITDFKLKMIHGLESNITIPASGFCVRNENSIRLAYFSHTMKYITLMKGLEAARFFKSHGIIDEYNERNGSVFMYRKTIKTIEVPNACPIMSEVFALIEWNDINLTTYQVLTIAARFEYESYGIGATVVSMFGNLKRA